MALGVIERRLKEIPKERQILVICQSGMRSSQAAKMLATNGYQVVNVSGGMTNWQRSGLKVIR